MAEGDEGKVIAIADHQKAVDTARAEAVADAKKEYEARASLIGDLCALAGHPEAAAEFLAKSASIEDVRTWAKEQSAKAKAPATGVDGRQPAVGAQRPKGFAMTSEQVFAKRQQELDEARAQNPIINRIRAQA